MLLVRLRLRWQIIKLFFVLFFSMVPVKKIKEEKLIAYLRLTCIEFSNASNLEVTIQTAFFKFQWR